MIVWWYRYDDRTFAPPVDEWDREIGQPTQGLCLSKWFVLRETPKGVWLESEFGGMKRFVLRDARKRFACPTRREALDSYLRRKARQIKILKEQLRRAMVAEALGEYELANLADNPADLTTTTASGHD